MQITFPQLQVLRQALRTRVSRVFGPLAAAMGHMGISPNALTVMGFLLTLPVAYLLAHGNLRIGGLLLIFTTLFDGIDGLVARAAGKTSQFGAFLDSTLDRYAEGVIFLGLLVHLHRQDDFTGMVLLFVALLGSVMVSYTRARAEGLGLECSVGFLSRLERLVILILGLLLLQLRLALWVLAIGSNITALQRIIQVWQSTRNS